MVYSAPVRAAQAHVVGVGSTSSPCAGSASGRALCRGFVGNTGDSGLVKPQIQATRCKFRPPGRPNDRKRLNVMPWGDTGQDGFTSTFSESSMKRLGLGDGFGWSIPVAAL